VPAQEIISSWQQLEYYSAPELNSNIAGKCLLGLSKALRKIEA
jgi:hypothetical protein